MIGLGVELDAIAAVAVGGTALTGGKAYITGTLIGALIIQLLRYTLLAHGIPDAARCGAQGRRSSSSRCTCDASGGLTLMERRICPLSAHSLRCSS